MPPRLAEGFSDLGTQQRAVQLGVWVFLASETLLFGGLFGLYAAYRTGYGDSFVTAAGHNDTTIGTINTMVLIVSSFFVAWAVHAADHARRRTAILSLVAVIALGAVFLTLKGVEYSHHLDAGLAPGTHYSSTELAGPGPRMFFTLYFLMTGLHALHVIAGMVIMMWLAIRIARRRIDPDYHPELEVGGLYWHLIDVIWIFLWPLLYLTG